MYGCQVKKQLLKVCSSKGRAKHLKGGNIFLHKPLRGNTGPMRSQKTTKRNIQPVKYIFLFRNVN